MWFIDVPIIRFYSCRSRSSTFFRPDQVFRIFRQPTIPDLWRIDIFFSKHSSLFATLLFLAFRQKTDDGFCYQTIRDTREQGEILQLIKFRTLSHLLDPIHVFVFVQWTWRREGHKSIISQPLRPRSFSLPTILPRRCTAHPRHPLAAPRRRFCRPYSLSFGLFFTSSFWHTSPKHLARGLVFSGNQCFRVS